MKYKKVIVFDLDDTLIQEIDFLKSAYREISKKLSSDSFKLYKKMVQLYHSNKNVFQYLEDNYPTSVNKLLHLYRTHFPHLQLNEGAEEILQYCRKNDFLIGIVTDGRSITQRNKLKAVNLEEFFDKIIISEEVQSEKPALKNYEYFNLPNTEKYYVGDNPKKDFVTPNKLGWTTICLLDHKKNIHPQDFSLPKAYLPQHRIENLNDIIPILGKGNQNW